MRTFLFVIGENSVQALNAIEHQICIQSGLKFAQKNYEDIKLKQTVCIMYHKTQLLRIEPSF